MELLNRQQVLDADDSGYEDVPTPEWKPGSAVRIRRLYAHERDRWESSLIKDRRNGRQTRNWDNARARLVVMAAVDSQGAPVFSEDDVVLLGRKSALVLERLFDSARRQAGMTEEDIEESRRSFEKSQGDAADSPSPSPSAAPSKS